MPLYSAMAAAAPTSCSDKGIRYEQPVRRCINAKLYTMVAACFHSPQRNTRSHGTKTSSNMIMESVCTRKGLLFGNSKALIFETKGLQICVIPLVFAGMAKATA